MTKPPRRLTRAPAHRIQNVRGRPPRFNIGPRRIPRLRGPCPWLTRGQLFLVELRIGHIARRCRPGASRLPQGVADVLVQLLARVLLDVVLGLFPVALQRLARLLLVFHGGSSSAGKVRMQASVRSEVANARRADYCPAPCPLPASDPPPSLENRAPAKA